MKRFCGMTDKNCKRNATGLVEKLAIEVVGAENTPTFTGRTYRIHPYATILARRKAAGLEWVSRDRSRRFVQKDGSPLTSSNLPESYPTPGAGVATTTPLGSLLGSIEKVPSTTTGVDLIVQALAEKAGVADAGAANRLISECRSACPSATTSEIVGIVQEKAFAARSRRDVRNLIGFLLSTVPPVFEGQGIVSYLALRQTPATIRKPAPNWQAWLIFFLRSLDQQKRRLATKIELEKMMVAALPNLSVEIVEYVRQHGRATMGEIMRLTGTSRNTLKEHLAQLVDKRHLARHGTGKGSWYALR